MVNSQGSDEDVGEEPGNDVDDSPRFDGDSS